MTGSLQQLLMMDETISYIKRILRGIEVTPETLAVEVIDRMGPGGNSLADDHTLSHFRSEFWFPTLIDRSRRDRWEARGKTTMAQRTQAKLIQILDSHKPAPLSAAARQTITEVLAGADARCQAQQS